MNWFSVRREKLCNGWLIKMKIGILTFHSQLNYGGVLQCWALQTALEQLGHEVVVIDRWLNSDNFLLERGYDQWTCKQWIKFWIRSLLGLGDLNQWLRVRRTKKFLRKYLKRTPYHFVDWQEAPKELGVDMLVVGSDQVWHCGDWGEPAVYLLEEAPKIPAIAYAASFGLTEIPAEFKDLYERGLPKFKAISCREVEGVELCRKSGAEATHVVDPTLLAWCAGPTVIKTPKRDLVCYFLSEQLEEHWQVLEDFAKKNNCKVRVLLGEYAGGNLPLPYSWRRMQLWLRGIWQKINPLARVKVLASAGPEEFVTVFKHARWVASDSFHALMFAINNNCNARIIRPHSEMRQKMFARIEEFAAHTEGPLIADSVSAALDSLASGEEVKYDYEWIKQRVEYSKEWLRGQVSGVRSQGSGVRSQGLGVSG